MSALIEVRHNIEVAHRLHLLPGKCENIHGHSMWVELQLCGELDNLGLLGGLDFGVVKHSFRRHLDTHFDHRLLLDADDPLVRQQLPGLRVTAGQPTTENLAKAIGGWAQVHFNCSGQVTVRETHVNAAAWSW